MIRSPEGAVDHDFSHCGRPQEERVRRRELTIECRTPGVQVVSHRHGGYGREALSPLGFGRCRAGATKDDRDELWIVRAVNDVWTG